MYLSRFSSRRGEKNWDNLMSEKLDQTPPHLEHYLEFREKFSVSNQRTHVHVRTLCYINTQLLIDVQGQQNFPRHIEIPSTEF